MLALVHLSHGSLPFAMLDSFAEEGALGADVCVRDGVVRDQGASGSGDNEPHEGVLEDTTVASERSREASIRLALGRRSVFPCTKLKWTPSTKATNKRGG